MSLLEKWKGVRYRARIFDHSLHIATVEVPDRGQRYITITVKKKILGFLGEETKLAFMINPDIPPKIFGGFIQELDFDIKDATPMADLLDVIPDLVYEINENYKVIQETKEIKKKTLQDIIQEIKNKPEIESAPESAPVSIPVTEETEKKEEVQKIQEPKKPGLITTSKKLMDTLSKLRKEVDGSEKNKLIKDCLELCMRYPKLMYWIPKHLKIDQEIHAIVSQSRIKRYGVMPSYYVNQANAMIAEKVLARPAPKPGWQDVIIIIAVFAFILVFIALLLHAVGMF